MTPAPSRSDCAIGAVSRRGTPCGSARLGAESGPPRLEDDDVPARRRHAPRDRHEARAVERGEALDVEREDANDGSLAKYVDKVRRRQVHLIAVGDRRARKDDPVQVARERHEVRAALATRRRAGRPARRGTAACTAEGKTCCRRASRRRRDSCRPRARGLRRGALARTRGRRGCRPRARGFPSPRSRPG